MSAGLPEGVIGLTPATAGAVLPVPEGPAVGDTAYRAPLGEAAESAGAGFPETGGVTRGVAVEGAAGDTGRAGGAAAGRSAEELN